MDDRYDIAVIGGGPAGLAAAAEAGRAGATVVLLDDQPAPGGQIYRGIAQAHDALDRIAGREYAHGRDLLAQATESGAEICPRSVVWWADGDGSVAFTRDGATHLIRAERLIVATGSMERPVPVPGWTLPGAMTAGAAQGLLKASGMAARDAIFVGTGPLLYLAAVQYLRAGFAPRAVLDATPWSHYMAALPLLPAALRNAPLLGEGLGLMRALRRAGVPVIRSVSGLRIRGTQAVEGVRYRKGDGWHELATAHVFLHLGVVPNINLSLALGCDHTWHEGQQCWHAVTDGWGRASLANVFLAGDGAAIGGAIAAEGQGRLAAWQALYEIGRLTPGERDRRARPVQRVLAREAAVRRFLDRLFRPLPAWRIGGGADEIVCRCEAVSLGEIRHAVDQGARALDGLKVFTRCGMGPCQGRLCGLTVAEILAQECNLPLSSIAPYHARFPLKPVTLGEMASLAGRPPEHQ